MGSTFKDPKRVAAGKKAKRKGNSFERNIAKKFQAWWGKGHFRKTPSSGGWSTKEVREEFRTAGDIITTAEDFPFCCELKKQEGWNLEQLILNDSPIILKWWGQTVDETPEGMSPLLVFARNYIKPMVMFSLDGLGWKLYDVVKYRSFRLDIPQEPIPSAIMSLEDFFKIPPSEFEKVD